MFAEKQRSELMELLEKNKDFRPTPIVPGNVPSTVAGAIKNVGGRYLVDFVKSANVFSDPCNIMITSALGTFWYRNPYCNPSPKPPLEDQDYEIDVPIPEGEGIFFLYTVSITTEETIILPNGKRGFYRNEVRSNTNSVGLPYTGDVKVSASFDPSVLVTPQWSANFSVGYDVEFDANFYNTRIKGSTLPAKDDGWQYSDSDDYSTVIYGDSGTKTISVNTPQRPRIDPDIVRQPAVGSVRIFQSRLEMTRYLEYMSSIGVPVRNYRRTVGNVTSTGVISFYGMPLPTQPPPPPKPPKDCECMCCDKNPNDDALLKLILKRIGNLPASVPDNFTKQNPSYINVESLAELALWQMQQLDALMGAYPIKIEVEDTDLTQAGDQTQKLELPNQAEVLAEILGMMITIKKDTHATLITAIKAMGEAGMTKNLATQALDVTLGNAEFLGYKLDQVKRKIPSLFTPNGTNLTETLQEKEIEIVSYENTDKKDLQDDLKYLKTMAARWNAQNWRQVTGDPVESLKQTLFGNPDAIQEVHKDNEQGDFNDFTEQAERGFIEVSGITDSVNPWGRPYDQRPKIREIGTEKGNYKNDGTAKVE